VTELQQNRYDQLMRRVGDLKGPGSKVNDVLQELFPVIDVENVPGELLVLMGTRVGWVAASTSPGVGERGGIQLFNPAGSGHIITVTKVHVSVVPTMNITMGLASIAFPTFIDIALFRDGRILPSGSGVAQIRTSLVATAKLSVFIRIIAGNTYEFSDPNGVCILGPGTGIEVVAGATNSGISCTYVYRERVAEPSELNF